MGARRLGHGQRVLRRRDRKVVQVATRLAVLARAPRPRRQAYRVLPPESEESFQRRVLELARWMGWSAYHTFDSRGSQPGFPDLVLVRAPRVIFAELKKDTARRQLPLHQAWWHAQLERCPGIETYVWRPKQWSDVRQVLARC